MPKLWLNDKHIGSVKGILFDKDGTLANSENYLVELAKRRIQAIQQVLKSVRTNDSVEIKSLLENLYGINNNYLDPSGLLAIASKKDNLIATATIIYMHGESWPDATKIAIDSFALAENLMIEKNTNSRELLPGVKDLFIRLQSAGISAALISNDTEEGIANFIKENGLQKIIKQYWSAEDNPPKPNPAAVKGLCNKIDLDPSECALIGDADSDLRMAQEAGIAISIGYISGWKKRIQLSQQEHLIIHWDDLGLTKS